MAEPHSNRSSADAIGSISHRRSSSRRRMESDVMKLLMSEFDVNLINDSMKEFDVVFPGPPDTPYEGGEWRVHVELPDDFPYKSPSIGFLNSIFHPNIDERSGSVCLDVINQTWTPIYGLINIFESFLPQLLRYPNPSDPLNSDASSLLLKDPKSYEKTVKEYVKRCALPRSLSAQLPDSADTKSSVSDGNRNAPGPSDSEEESEMSALSDDE